MRSVYQIEVVLPSSEGELGLGVEAKSTILAVQILRAVAALAVVPPSRRKNIKS
jgi:hypothetical protein